eukprot:TRINITY_DN51360_c0_g1_i1.p1 TRINITY_DN51360_c0_g1~~TRINITY_DN51360_c0_g1_i1.p1  ORF type:complete len:204 (-),score=42.23 TRINITY_DN51360_c0_g1_i1:102-668(-)
MADSSGSGFTNVHVRGLPEDCDDGDVDEALRRILTERRKQDGSSGAEEDDDRLVACNVVRDKVSFKCKGYCFLSFNARDEADFAIKVLNEGGGVEIFGCQLQAQISQPKERHAPKKDPYEDLKDLRLHRQRYQVGCKKAQMGNVTCSDKSKRVTKGTGSTSQITGTRGQKIVDDTAKCSSRSGFDFAK